MVIDGVFRGEIRVERLGFHVHYSGQCPKGERIQAFTPNHLPGFVEDLPLGRLMSGVPPVRARYRNGFLGHCLTLAEQSVILLTVFGNRRSPRGSSFARNLPWSSLGPQGSDGASRN